MRHAVDAQRDESRTEDRQRHSTVRTDKRQLTCQTSDNEHRPDYDVDDPAHAGSIPQWWPLATGWQGQQGLVILQVLEIPTGCGKEHYA